MTKINLTTRQGESSSFDVPVGRSLMQAVRDLPCDELQAICGGCCSCATCHVYIDGADMARLPAMSDDEDALLDASDHRKPCSRLSCQIPVTDALDGLRVTIAPEDY